MSDQYRFQEVRKGSRDDVVTFAAAHGCAIEPNALRHHMSLSVQRDGELVAAALSTEDQPSQIVIEVVIGADDLDPALITELADRCLRKVQAHDIASARLHSPTPEPTDAIWQQTNWLDQIEETPPHEPEPLDHEHDEAAAEATPV